VRGRQGSGKVERRSSRGQPEDSAMRGRFNQRAEEASQLAVAQASACGLERWGETLENCSTGGDEGGIATRPLGHATVVH